MNSNTTNNPAEAGASATPTVNLADLKLRELIAAKPAYSDIEKLGLARMVGWAKETATWATKVKDSAKEFRGTSKAVGVIYAAFQTLYAKAQDAGTLDKGTTFKDYVKSVTGSPPETHALSCGQLFCRLVLSAKLITEAQYHTCATDWLEKANSIVSHVLANGGDLNSDPTILAVVDILTLKTATVDTAAKALREMRNKQTGKAEVEAGELNAEKLIAILDTAGKAGLLPTVFAHLPDVTATLPEAGRKELWAAWEQHGGYCNRITNSFGNAETTERWLAEIRADEARKAAFVAGPALNLSTSTPAPATPVPTPETPAVENPAELAAA